MGARFSKPRALHGVHDCVAHGGHVSDVTALHCPVVTGDSNLHKLRYNARTHTRKAEIVPKTPEKKNCKGIFLSSYRECKQLQTTFS